MGRGGAGVGESNHEQRKKDGKGKTWQKKGRKEEERKGRKEGNMCIEGVRQKKMQLQISCTSATNFLPFIGFEL